MVLAMVARKYDVTCHTLSEINVSGGSRTRLKKKDGLGSSPDLQREYASCKSLCSLGLNAALCGVMCDVTAALLNG
jgi:hypothetical protein